MSPAGSPLSLQEQLAASLKPLGGALRIDGFVRWMARERARLAAEEKAAREAALQAEAARQAARPKKAKARPAEERPAEVTDEVKAFMQRDQVGETSADEVSEFLDYMGSAGFDPESLPE
jgi:hypothetical protein